MLSEDYFDFEEKSEKSEEQNFDKLKECPHCRKPIPQDTLVCFYCGEGVHYYRKPKWIVWVAVLVIVAFAALILMH